MSLRRLSHTAFRREFPSVRSSSISAMSQPIADLPGDELRAGSPLKRPVQLFS